MAHSNPYRGVNAHLHSYFQAHGGWTSFHTNYISALTLYLATVLPPGYMVDTEQSLQIREFHPDTGERIRRFQPDLTVYRSEEMQTPHAADAYPVVVLPLTATLPEREALFYSAVVIYPADADPLFSRPVTRIELLSPGNKSGDGAVLYADKRYIALMSGVALVEIDLLHETPPIIRGLPEYPHQPDSAPYNIIVSDPNPSFREGTTSVYLFGVDEPLPKIALPLGSGNAVSCDLDLSYQDLYSRMPAFHARTDVNKPPLNFDRYSQADQARITRVMASAADKR